MNNMTQFYKSSNSYFNSALKTWKDLFFCLKNFLSNSKSNPAHIQNKRIFIALAFVSTILISLTMCCIGCSETSNNKEMTNIANIANSEQDLDNAKSEYAKLAIKVGINVQAGSELAIVCPVQCYDIAEKCVKEAYDAGAKNVSVLWSDESITNVRINNITPDTKSLLNPGYSEIYTKIAQEKIPVLHIVYPQFDLEAVNQDKYKIYSKEIKNVNGAASDLETGFKIPWNMICIPNESWAKMVFPDKNDDEALKTLWNYVIYACRIDINGNTLQNWQNHINECKNAAVKLNSTKFSKLQYKNGSGTDFSIELPQKQIWISGQTKDETNHKFVPNIPTEEVFSAPNKYSANGKITASKPLMIDDNKIEGLTMKVENGKIVDAHADVNEDILLEYLNKDEYCRYFGEVALTSYDNPISQLNTLFYQTLYDENAACHIAFGEAYPMCYEGGENMSTSELNNAGINAGTSEHWDFMIGTSDLEVVGTTTDGQEIKLIENGKFTDFFTPSNTSK